MQAFLTGSHAYGEPNEESDIDLVIYTDHTTADFLREYSEQQEEAGNRVVRFGKLNLILCVTMPWYSSWLYGTMGLLKMRDKTGESVSREKAVTIFKKIQERLGLCILDGGPSILDGGPSDE